MTRRILASASILALFAATGCSSSSNSSGPPANDDSGTTSQDSGTTPEGDSGTSTEDSGTTSGDSSTTTMDSGSTNPGDSSTEDGGASCTALTAVTATIPTWTPVTATSACSMANVNDWLTACASATATMATCSAFNTANAACAACIVPSPDSGASANAGAIIVDDNNNAYLNVPACVQLADGNSNCAAPLYQLSICEDDACNSTTCLADGMSSSPTDQAAVQACDTAADNGACGTYYTPAMPCVADQADGGSLAANGSCGSAAAVIYKLCGNGS